MLLSLFSGVININGITAIIPCHKPEFVGETIESLKRQTYPINEIILIDDCANLEEYDGVTMIRNNERCGKAKSLNAAIPHALNSIVVLVDSDSVLADDCVEKMMETFNGNIAVVTPRLYPKDKNHWVTRVRKKLYDKWAKVGWTIINGCTVLSSKNFLIKHPFCTDSMTEDEQFTEQVNESDKTWLMNKDAKVYTEEPKNSRELFRQIVRWSFGTYQSNQWIVGLFFIFMAALILLTVWGIMMTGDLLYLATIPTCIIGIFVLMGAVNLTELSWDMARYSFITTIAEMYASLLSMIGKRPGW